MKCLKKENPSSYQILQKCRVRVRFGVRVMVVFLKLFIISSLILLIFHLHRIIDQIYSFSVCSVVLKCLLIELSRFNWYFKVCLSMVWCYTISCSFFSICFSYICVKFETALCILLNSFVFSILIFLKQYIVRKLKVLCEQRNLKLELAIDTLYSLSKCIHNGCLFVV